MVKIVEVRQDLFSMDPKTHVYTHCISADCKMGAGIAVAMKKRFNLGGLGTHGICKVGECVCFHNVLNLITKKRYFNKPTYDSLRAALVDMKDYCKRAAISKVAMPRIGCGLDRLKWPMVRQIIEDVFCDSDIEITVCYQ